MMARVIVVNKKGEARPVRVLSHYLFQAHLPVLVCWKCDGNIHQDLATIHQPQDCPHCGAVLITF
jgi:rubrerythrin